MLNGYDHVKEILSHWKIHFFFKIYWPIHNLEVHHDLVFEDVNHLKITVGKIETLSSAHSQVRILLSTEKRVLEIKWTVMITNQQFVIFFSFELITINIVQLLKKDS